MFHIAKWWGEETYRNSFHAEGLSDLLSCVNVSVWRSEWKQWIAVCRVHCYGNGAVAELVLYLPSFYLLRVKQLCSGSGTNQSGTIGKSLLVLWIGRKIKIPCTAFPFCYPFHRQVKQGHMSDRRMLISYLKLTTTTSDWESKSSLPFSFSLDFIYSLFLAG